MSTPAPVPALRGTITVGVPVERAFSVFTGSIGTWWPPDYHIGQADMAEAILEPREGGRWYERGVDGSECDWGKVLAWVPPHHRSPRPRPRSLQAASRAPPHRPRGIPCARGPTSRYPYTSSTADA